MTSFRRRPQAREKTVSVRMTSDQADLLLAVAQRLGMRGVSDVIRAAIDFYLGHDQDAARASQNRDSQE